MSIQTHLDTKQTINLGSFYTPDFIVQIAHSMLTKEMENTKDYILLDSSCGYGSFLNLQGFKQKIGIDIDKEALKRAKDRFKNHSSSPIFLHLNALYQVKRENFQLKQDDKLIIIGNPPFNDKSSIVQKHLKEKQTLKIDKELQTRDIGISFLRSFDVLNANYICVLHPLSYLIKETNFKTLKNFSKHYVLVDSCIISSQIFCPKSLSYFPIIIALYKKDKQGMDFNFISNFSFKSLEGRTFKLSDFEFISKYIDKYPNKNRIKDSQKIAMFYTMRDINALRRSKTFIDKDCTNALYITKEKYSLYCYVDVFKMMISCVPYYLGNCDILIDFKAFKNLESHFIKASENKVIDSKIKDYFKALLGGHYEN